MRQHGRGPKIALLGFILWLAQPAAFAWPGETEQRDYSILIDGKDSGQSLINITVENDGTTVVTANAQVKFTHLFIHTTYKVESTEWWKNGKLTGLKANTVENGKRTEVTAASDGTRLNIKLNGRDRIGSTEAWTSSFWKLPDPRDHNNTIPVLESDSGKEYACRLQYVGTEQLTYLNQPQSCYRFQVTGGPYPVDVWYDKYHRLVRQEFVDLGHKTIVQIIGLKR